MKNTQEVPTQQAAINELRAGATSAEDHATVDAWQDELDYSRAQAHKQLGMGTAKLVSQPDGSFATEHEHAIMQAEGQEISGTSSAGRRS